MSLGEFSLIQRYFKDQSVNDSDSPALLGIGDDGAVMDVPNDYQLVQTIDTLIAGRHFPEPTNPFDIAYKSLAVNVSDLAAMAADPAWFVLSLTLPDSDEAFLKEFSSGLFTAAREFSIQLVGGDTCKGPLSITIQASGLVPNNHYVTRAGAQVGDQIYVSGTIGSAAVALAAVQGQIALPEQALTNALLALNHPQPRLDLIPILRQHASAAIDISDGLIADLGHILERSQVGARIDKLKLPVDPWIGQHDGYDYALKGGDDYQLLFTVPKDQHERVLETAQRCGITITHIGEIIQHGYVMDDAGQTIPLNAQGGFDHFAG